MPDTFSPPLQTLPGESSALKKVQAAVDDLLACLSREQFFGPQYTTNTDNLAECLKALAAALKDAGVPDAVDAWNPMTANQLAGQTADYTQQLLRMGADANGRWVRTLFDMARLDDKARWEHLRSHVARYGEAVVASLAPSVTPKGKPGRRGYPLKALTYAKKLREKNPTMKAHSLRRECLKHFSEEDLPPDGEAFRRWLNRKRKNRAN